MPVTWLRRQAPWIAAGASVAVLGSALAVLALVPAAAGAGTPERSLVLLLVVLGACIAVMGPGVVIAALVPPSFIRPSLRPVTAIIAAGVVGWLVLWVWFLHPVAGGIVAIVVLVGTAAGLVVVRRALVDRDLARPFGLAALVTLATAALAFDHGGFADGGLTVALRYWVSVDDIIPKLFADALLHDRESLKSFLEGWLSSDRPALQTGMVLPAYWLSAPENRAMAYVPLGMAANALWIPGVWSLLRVLRIGERRIGIVVLALATCGAIFFNFAYVWPKLLAAAFVLAAFAVVLDRGIPRLVAAIAAAAAAALALFSHGGAAFGLLGLAPFVILAIRRWRWRATLAGLGAAIVVYAPWMTYQRLFEPPGDRLVKWHLAGVIAPTPTPPLEAVIGAYADAGFAGTLANKLANVEVILGSPTVWNWLVEAHGDSPWTLGPIGFVRIMQSSSMLWALGILALGFVLLVIPRVRRQPWVRPLVVSTALTAVAFALLEFGSPDLAIAWLHHGPYSLLLLGAAAGALAITALRPPLAAAILSVHVALFLVAWVITVNRESAFGGDPGRWEIGMAAVALGATALAAASVVRTDPAPVADAEPAVAPTQRSAT